MQRLRTVTSLDVSAVAGHHAMPAALLLRFKSDVLQRLHYNSHHIIFSKTFFFNLQEANHETMIISYGVTSCATLKCIISCLNFGIEDNFIDGECLMIDMKHAVNTI